MAYRKQPINALEQFLPTGAYPKVQAYLLAHKIGLTITKARKSKYGDYYYDRKENRHKISVNGNLNVYEFLITLLHEIAHLITFDKYQHAVDAHGKEWKHIFGEILDQFIRISIFPEDITKALNQHIRQVKSSHCRDEHLVKVLQAYDENPTISVSDIGIGNYFEIDNGRRQFQVLEKMRTRFKCLSMENHKIYIFPSAYPVTPLLEK